MTTNESIPAGLPPWLADHLPEVLTWGPAPVGRSCFVPGCRRDAHLLGLCKPHHLRAKRAWRPSPSQERYRRKPELGPTSGLETVDSKTTSEEAAR